MPVKNAPRSAYTKVSGLSTNLTTSLTNPIKLGKIVKKSHNMSIICEKLEIIPSMLKNINNITYNCWVIHNYDTTKIKLLLLQRNHR